MAQIGSGEPTGSPWARRLQQARWRDPRLLIGVLLVIVCVVVGARLLTTADDYVFVWAAKRDLSVGAALGATDVAAQAIRFRDQGDADRYLSATQPVSGAVLARPLGAGELVPRAALAAPGVKSLDELPLAVDQAAAPSDLREGDVVDVWVVPASSVGSSVGGIGRGRAEAPPAASQVLSGVVVISAGADIAALGGSGVRTVVVGVDEATAPLSSVLPALVSGDVILVRRGA